VGARFRGPQELRLDVMPEDNGAGRIEATSGPGDPFFVCENPPGVPSTCARTYRIGTLVTLQAVPGPDSVFLGWMGACNSTEPTCSVLIDEMHAVGARFRGPQELRLDIMPEDNGAGRIEATSGPDDPFFVCENPPGVPHTCSRTYRIGTLVTLQAVPGPDSVFLGWMGACNGTEPTCSVLIDEMHAVGARFRSLAELRVEVVLNGDAAAKVEGGIEGGPAILCEPAPGQSLTCSQLYPANVVVRLWAMPAPETEFLGWTGACTGLETICTVEMSQAQAVRAEFRSMPRHELRVEVVLMGSAVAKVEGGPVGGPAILCEPAPGQAQTCTQQYRQGTTVRLWAMATDRAFFAGWTGACTGLDPVCTVEMSQAQSVRAEFRPSTRELRIRIEPVEDAAGRVEAQAPNAPPFSCESQTGQPAQCAQTYELGTVVRLVAVPAAGSTFGSWTGPCLGSTAPACDVTIDAPLGQSIDAGAVFIGSRPRELSLILDSIENGAGRVEGTAPGRPPGVCENPGGSTVSCRPIYPLGTVVTLVATATPGSTFGGWTGDCTGTAPTCTVTIRDGGNATHATFVRPAPVPTLTLITPNGGESWGKGSRQRIEWTHTLGAGRAVRIEISRNGGASWTVLAASVPNATASSGFYDWTVAGANSTSVRLRVVSTSNPGVADASDASFRIAGPLIHVTAPDAGGATWTIGSTRTIRWDHNLGTNGTARIRISRDGGSTYMTIAETVTPAASSGAYNWIVAGPTTSRARIRVEWKSNTAVNDKSDRDFAIRP
jgi:hypothetical protein